MNYDGSRDGDQGGHPEAAGSDEPGAFVPIVLTAEPGKDLLIPDGAWILGGQYVRQGADLVIKGADGQLVVVRGFFNLASPPDLHTDGGAVINAQLATRLAGPLAPGEVAQAGAPAGPQAGVGEPIGKVTAADGVVEATHVDGTKVRLKAGDPVYQGDILETGKDGAVGVEFADQSTFSLGDSGRMVLDEMVYDPGGAAENNSFAMSLVQGTFSFVSGQISKTDPEAMQLNTPVATIGIRGTTIAGKVGGEGQENTLSLLPDPGGSTGEIVISNAAGTVVLNTVGATVTVTSVNQAPPQPVTLSPQELASRYDNVLTINPAQPQANPDDAANQDQGPPPDVLDALNDIGQQLNKAVAEGLQQQQQFQVQIDQVKLDLLEVLRPPQIDPRPFIEQFKSIAKDYGGVTGELADIVTSISAAASTASTAEKVATAKAQFVLASAKSTAGSPSLGLTQAQQDSLGSELGALATAPLKSLGAAAAISSTASSLSKAVLAATAAAAKGESISTDLLDALKASALELTTAAARIAKIVTAVTGQYTVNSNGGYTFTTQGAADKVLAQVKTAAEDAKRGGGDFSAISTAAKNKVASQFKTEVTSQLAADQVGDTDVVQFDDISGIVTGVKDRVQSISTAAQGAGGLELMLSALSRAESAAAKAEDTAVHAKATMDPADVAAMLASAEAALQAATEADGFRAEVDGLVIISELLAGVDASALGAFLDAVEKDLSSETESSGATAAIKAAVAGLEAAADFVDGTLQATLANATTAQTAARAAKTAANTAAEAAAAAVVEARSVLIDKLVSKAVALARANVLEDAADTADGEVADAQADVDAATTARDAAQTAAATATALSDADPTNAVLIADAVLKTQLLANAEAALDFAEDVLGLWQGAQTTARGNATTARSAADAATTAADTAQADVDNLEAASATKLAAALDATEAAADADAAVARAEGALGVGRAAAEAEAQASLALAVESAQFYADQAEEQADIARQYAEIARSHTIIGTANKVLAHEAEAVSVAAAAQAKIFAQSAADSAADAEDASELSYVSTDAAATAARAAALAAAKAAANSAELAADAAEASAAFATAAGALADVVNPEPVDPGALQAALRAAEQAADQAAAEAAAKAAAEAAARAAAETAAAAQVAAEAQALANATAEAAAAKAAAAQAALKAADAAVFAAAAAVARTEADTAEAADDAVTAAAAATEAEEKSTLATQAAAAAALAAQEADLRAQSAAAAAAGADGRLSIFERDFNRCMGLAPTETGFYMSSLYQLWRFENILPEGRAHHGYDRAYLPLDGHTTGDLDIHDIAVDGDGRVVFVNTLFSCLATTGRRESFVPLWQPPFVSKLAAEDRCHLNGMAMVSGKPKYVTAVGDTDVADGWRDKRGSGGVVLDVASGAVVASGLSMPHSPRVHGGKLWLLNSGTGELGYVEPDSGRFEAVAFCPGYLRGLSFHGDFAVVGLSKPRENGTFSGLPLDAALKARNADAQCGLYVIDLRSGDAVHWLRIEGIVQELYDVIFLPGVRRPMAFGFKSDEIRRTLNVGAFGTL